MDETTTTNPETVDITEGARGASSPLCYRCGLRPRVVDKTRTQPYCRECMRELRRERYEVEKLDIKRCEHCGVKLPHANGKRCPVQWRRYLIDRGRQFVNTTYPGYGDLLSD